MLCAARFAADNATAARAMTFELTRQSIRIDASPFDYGGDCMYSDYRSVLRSAGTPPAVVIDNGRVNAAFFLLFDCAALF